MNTLLQKSLKLNEAKLTLIQNYLPYRYQACYISTSILRNHEEGSTRKSRFAESYKRTRQAAGLMDINYRYNDVFLQTIGSGAYGSCQSLSVQSHHHRYLFNCGEGTQRIAEDNKISADYFTRLFLTSCSWENISGFPGYELQDKKERDCSHPVIRKIYGPSGLVNFVKSYSELYKNSLEFERCLEIKSEEINVNNKFIVKAEALYPKGLENGSRYVLAYSCTFPSEPGVISTEKLVLHDIPPGPLVDDLKNGKSVTLSDGRIVTPLDVRNYYYKPSSFIVLEIPTFEYLESLISSSAFDKYKKDMTPGNPEENDLEVIVHFSPPEVMKDSRYRQWVNSFPSSVSNIIINKSSSCLGLHSPIKMQLQLNRILPNIFPLHRNPGIPIVSSEEDTLNVKNSLDPLFTSEYKFESPTVQSNTALQYFFRPDKRFRSSSPVINPIEIRKEMLEVEPLINSIKELKTVYVKLDIEKSLAVPSPYPNILFLGTGASWGSLVRNDTSILIETRPQSYIMLDCGKSTLGQLVRLMGKAETKSILRNLKVIFVSHYHQDHHIGLTSILTERRNAFLEAGIETPYPIHVIAPLIAINFLRNIHENFGLDLKGIHSVNSKRLTWGDEFFSDFHHHKMITLLQLRKISVPYVNHCKNSHGIALEHEDGWKIVYSGDCSPSLHLVEEGKNCDLLIHEATFEDELKKHAENRLHSTVSQAVQVGKDMNAKFTILTHFSHRYHSMPLVKERIFEENVGIAFDFMKVNFQDLPYLKYMYPTLKELFYKDFIKNEAHKYRRVNFNTIY